MTPIATLEMAIPAETLQAECGDAVAKDGDGEDEKQ